MMQIQLLIRSCVFISLLHLSNEVVLMEEDLACPEAGTVLFIPTVSTQEDCPEGNSLFQNDPVYMAY